MIAKPANEAYVMPIGIAFITMDNEYMQETIVMAVIKLGKRRVKPSELFAKLFDVTPKKTAKARNKYEVVMFIQSS